MATAKKEKTTVSKTVKKASTAKKSSKKKTTIEQIENLEKALKNTKEEDIISLVPDEIKADIKEEKPETAENVRDQANLYFDEQKEADFDSEVKRIIESAEPSEEVKEQVKDFEEGKEEFNKKLEEEPEQAEKIVQDELKRVETLKKKVEAMKSNMQKGNARHMGNEGFTNWWNGSSGLY